MNTETCKNCRWFTPTRVDDSGVPIVPGKNWTYTCGECGCTESYHYTTEERRGLGSLSPEWGHCPWWQMTRKRGTAGG